MTIGAPYPAVDPQFGQLEGVRIRLAFCVEGGLTPAKDRNAFFLSALENDDRRPGNPFARARDCGFQRDAMAAIGLSTH